MGGARAGAGAGAGVRAGAGTRTTVQTPAPFAGSDQQAALDTMAAGDGQLCFAMYGKERLHDENIDANQDNAVVADNDDDGDDVDALQAGALKHLEEGMTQISTLEKRGEGGGGGERLDLSRQVIERVETCDGFVFKRDSALDKGT